MFPLSDSIESRRFPFVNILLILATIFVFLQQILSPSPDSLIQKYALIPANISFSNYQTLIPFVTAIFLHGGFLHIISNMWFLWVFGNNVDGYTGWFFYPILYFTAGIVGNLFQYFMMPSSTIPILGASGAIAGVLGVYYILFPHSKVKTLIPIFGLPAIINISAALLLGYWFILQLISGTATFSLSSSTGGVAFFAHIAGFVTGVIFGFFLKRRVETLL